MQPKYSALFTSVNLLLGVGPLILPSPYFNAGILLSTLWLVTVSVISYNSAMFVAESIDTIRKLSLRRRDQIVSITYTDSLLTQEDISEPELPVQNEEVKIDHSDQFRTLLGNRWALFPSFAIAIYLMGTSVSKCIMTGKIMAEAFQPQDGETSGSILSEFSFWIIIFFVCGAAFSFRSVDKTKPMQMIIISVRLVSILLLLGGALFLIFK